MRLFHAGRCYAALALALAASMFIWPAPLGAAPNNDVEIVYLDPNGVIRVLDPNPPSGSLAVTWASPSGGWTSFAVGDVTGDGDAEIIAIRQDGELGRLTVFDPVAISAPPERVQFFNGVEWAVLYDLPLEGKPNLVALGQFDVERPGMEIVFNMRYIPDPGQPDRVMYRFFVLRQPLGQSDGTQWEVQTVWDTRNAWNWIATGDVDGVAPDEIALVDSSTGTLSVVRVGQGFAPIFTTVNSNYAWRVAEFAQHIPGGPLELAAVRRAPPGLASFWLFRYENNTFVDHVGTIHLPSPEFLFVADIGGNGDDELVLMRPVPQEVSNRPRLWIVDNGNDPLGMTGAILDGDNGYQVGAGGDIDGDGRDELVIMRHNRIRIFTSPDQNASFTEFAVATDAATLRLGNLDAAGLGATPRLGIAPQGFAWDLSLGELGEPVTFSVRDETQGTAVAVRAELRNAPWASVTPLVAGTPASFRVSLDLEGIGPGTYQGELVISTQDGGVANNPAVAPLTLRVTSPVTVEPAELAFRYYPCPETPEIRSATVRVEGPAVPLQVTLGNDAPWLSVAPDAGLVPLTITVTADPSKRNTDVEIVELLIAYDLPNAVGVVTALPVTLVCTDNRILLPMLPVLNE